MELQYCLFLVHVAHPTALDDLLYRVLILVRLLASARMQKAYESVIVIRPPSRIKQLSETDTTNMSRSESG